MIKRAVRRHVLAEFLRFTDAAEAARVKARVAAVRARLDCNPTLPQAVARRKELLAETNQFFNQLGDEAPGPAEVAYIAEVNKEIEKLEAVIEGHREEFRAAHQQGIDNFHTLPPRIANTAAAVAAQIRSQGVQVQSYKKEARGFCGYCRQETGSINFVTDDAFDDDPTFISCSECGRGKKTLRQRVVAARARAAEEGAL